MTELKLCPFCGKNNIFIEKTACGELYYIVICGDCGCRTKSVRDPNEAVELWNKRAGSIVSAHWEEEEEENPEYFRFHYCSNCGEYALTEEDTEYLTPYCPECSAKMDNAYEENEELKVYSNYFRKKEKEERAGGT